METTRRKCRICRGSDDSEGSSISWGLLCDNLYADRLLNFNMFPQSVYEMREFYSGLVHVDRGYLVFKLLDHRNQVVHTQAFRLWNSIGQQVRSL